MKKQKLLLDIELDFNLIAISAHIKDYKMAWWINEKLSIQLKKDPEDHIIQVKNGEEVRFSKYNYHNNKKHHYTLLGNVSPNGYLLKELKSMDFFLILEGFSSEEILNNIRSIPEVQTAFELDPNALKEKELLILE